MQDINPETGEKFSDLSWYVITWGSFQVHIIAKSHSQTVCESNEWHLV
jgi:hypothetical protein